MEKCNRSKWSRWVRGEESEVDWEGAFVFSMWSHCDWSGHRGVGLCHQDRDITTSGRRQLKRARVEHLSAKNIQYKKSLENWVGSDGVTSTDAQHRCSDKRLDMADGWWDLQPVTLTIQPLNAAEPFRLHRKTQNPDSCPADRVKETVWYSPEDFNSFEINTSQ